MKTAITLLSIGLGVVVAAQDKAIGQVRVGTGPWSSVFSLNRNIGDVCRFNAMQIVSSFFSDFSGPYTFISITNGGAAETVTLDFPDKQGTNVTYDLEGVTVINARTLEGRRERVTLRYKKCTKKTRPPSSTP